MVKLINKYTLHILLFTLVFSCKNADVNLSKIEGKRLEIDNNLEKNLSVEQFIAPYRAKINANLDQVISYSPNALSKSDGELNTAIGNLMADAVFEETNPVFNTRTGKNIDFVLLNHGGIRSIISKGNITTRTAFEVMPFENAVVVVALKGTQINKLLTYLSKAKRAHPISKQLQIILNNDFSLKLATLHGKAINANNIYYVATNDYLYNGGDGMSFFHPNEGLYTLDYKIRNVLIDHFKKKDTLKPKIDKRFIRLKRLKD